METVVYEFNYRTTDGKWHVHFCYGESERSDFKTYLETCPYVIEWR